MKTKTRPHRHTVDLASCAFANYGEFRQDFPEAEGGYTRRMGSLDAPDLLPAGGTSRHLSIDRVREKIDAWPSAMTVRRD